MNGKQSDQYNSRPQMNITPIMPSQAQQMWTPWGSVLESYSMAGRITISNMKPLILTKAIAISMTKSMIILSGILFFPDIILYGYVHDIHDDVHGMNSPLPNL